MLQRATLRLFPSFHLSIFPSLSLEPLIKLSHNANGIMLTFKKKECEKIIFLPTIGKVREEGK